MSIDETWESGLVGKMAAGRYLIVSELATDSRRTLYEAENVELGVRVSLGVVRSEAAATAEQRLRDGAKLCMLKQPGLVAVLDVGKLDSGDLFVATELPAGTSLRALTTGKLLEQRCALSIMRQVLEALAAAHEIDAIHGDVKPESIMITGVDERSERVKLQDVGVATLSGVTKSGDPRYCAPECTLGKRDARSDLYSVGAVLFELLTGHPPFFAKDPKALRRLHAYAPTQTLQQRAPELRFAPALEELVATALAKKPDARFQSVNDMITALDAAAQAVTDARQAEVPAPPQRKRSDSLLLLAKDLLPATPTPEPALNMPLVPVNVDRQVRPLPSRMKARKLVRRMLARCRAVAVQVDNKLLLRARFGKLDRKYKLIVGVVAGTLVVAIVLAIAGAVGGSPKPRQHDVGQSAKALVDQGKTAQAVDLTTREVAAHPDNGAAYLAQGHAQLALGHERDALTAYENAILVTPKLGTDHELLADLTTLTDSQDPATAIAALDLLALRVAPLGNETIVAHASTSPLADVRHHAFGLAERAAVADKVDRVSSWILDLEQATTCDQRRAAISKLAGTGDHRALPALRAAKKHKCVAHQASSVIRKIATK